MQIDYSVAQALMQHSVGTVATAIEQHSCYHGRDRFGRLKLLQENEQEKIFKLLADYHIEEKIWYVQNEFSSDDGEAPSDIFDCNFELPHWHFGWPKDNIPDALKKITEIENDKEENISDIPKDSILVDDAIAKFEDEFSSKIDSIPFEARDEIYTKGRYTHLTIIGALIQKCNFKLDEPKIEYKIALIVSQNTGWAINERTIKNILKQIPGAIERKRK